MSQKKTLTIFTPSYNRADLLLRAYEALQGQSLKDFIWMIIDDGSTDNTEQVVKPWLSNDEFEVRYIKKENGGLYTGYNKAIELADTELMVCIDSDDYMPPDAVEKIISFWKKYGSDEYAGIVGLDCDLDGNIIGDRLPDIKSVNLIDLLCGKYNIVNGDRTNVVRTKLYKEVAPMIGFEGEKNFNPHYMHLMISKKYDFLVLNENLRFVEYQPGGLSDTMWKQYLSSPKSFAKTRILYLEFENTPLSFKIRNSIHYVSSIIIAGECVEGFKKCPRKGCFLVAFLPGVLLSIITKRRGK